MIWGTGKLVERFCERFCRFKTGFEVLDSDLFKSRTFVNLCEPLCVRTHPHYDVYWKWIWSICAHYLQIKKNCIISLSMAGLTKVAKSKIPTCSNRGICGPLWTFVSKNTALLRWIMKVNFKYLFPLFAS